MGIPLPPIEGVRTSNHDRSMGSKRWLGRTEFLTLTIRASPGWKAQTNLRERNGALSLSACRRVLERVLDTADIVRDGDISPTSRAPLKLSHSTLKRWPWLYSCGHCCAGNRFSTTTPPDCCSEDSRFRSAPRAESSCLAVILRDNKSMACLEASCPPATARAYQE